MNPEPGSLDTSAPRVETLGPAHRINERFDTGVPNLDLVLGGGLLRGTIVMVVGPPGSGKTILGQQIAFHAARRGEVALYFTGYSESHEKLLAHNRSLSYFSVEAIGTEVQMGSLPDLLAEGAEQAKQAVLESAQKEHASLVILDGFRSIRGFLPDDQAAAEFLYSLGAMLAMLGATLIVLVEGDATDRIRDPEQSVCDVILSLHRVVRGGGHRRALEVLKVRGAAPLAGLHPFAIDSNGVTIYPRLESVVPADGGTWTPARAGFGIPDIDDLISGGLNVATSTVAAGTPGLGKTLLGLHFLAEGARRGEPGLFAGFIESPAQLRAKARTFGIDLEAAERAGTLELLIIPPHDLDADLAAWRIRQRIEARHVRRLVIDSATELQGGLTSPERAAMFLASFAAYLRSEGVTTYMTVDVPTIVGPELSFTGNPLLVFAENLLLLRYAELVGELHRVFAVLKMRFSNFDRALRVYTIEDGVGIKIAGRAPRAEGLLTGLARPLTSQDPASLALIEPGI
ncbi:MAG: circadian clock protein KaiC [Chloroflexi bacterium]|nr:circadian clock protein KaiC [Chloroflexota bacterium]MBV9547328.1 circadian clock protein KaiC [Chloroflexota bacterium]